MRSGWLKTYAGLALLLGIAACGLAGPGSPNDALSSAVGNNDVAAIKAALAEKAELNAPNLAGDTPLMKASRLGNLEAVQALLAAGADVHARSSLGTALNLTTSPDVAAALLAAGADANAKAPIDSETALFEATRKHEVPLALVLINKGADVNKPAMFGFTPLMWAARRGDLTMSQTLINAGADINARDSDGRTALALALNNPASTSGQVDAVIALLKSNGAQ